MGARGDDLGEGLRVFEVRRIVPRQRRLGRLRESRAVVGILGRVGVHAGVPPARQHDPEVAKVTRARAHHVSVRKGANRRIRVVVATKLTTPAGCKRVDETRAHTGWIRLPYSKKNHAGPSDVSGLSRMAPNGNWAPGGLPPTPSANDPIAWKRRRCRR